MQNEDLEKYLSTIRSPQRSASTWVYPGFSTWSLLLIFLVFCFYFLCLSTVSCSQCCPLSLTFYFWLPLRFTLAFSYQYIFHVIPKHNLWHILLWFSYAFVQIILSDTHILCKFGRLLKALSSITDILLWCIFL